MTDNRARFAEFLRLQEQSLRHQLSLARAAVSHSGEKGRNLEHHAIKFLRSVLPGQYGLGTGFIAYVDNDEGSGPFVPKISTQLDIVIYDALRGGPIMDLDTFHVYPLEHVLGVVEVKASLNDELPGLFSQSARLRKMLWRHYLTFVPVPPKRDLTPEECCRAGYSREVRAGYVMGIAATAMLGRA